MARQIAARTGIYPRNGRPCAGTRSPGIGLGPFRAFGCRRSGVSGREALSRLGWTRIFFAVSLVAFVAGTVVSGSRAQEAHNVAGTEGLDADAMHAAVFVSDRFPTASICAQCHPKQYREWSVSPHAFGQFSPVVLAFQNASNERASGTINDFCQRCHAPISAVLGTPPAMSSLDRSLVERESITCIACHRVNQKFGRITGRYPILEGDIHEPVFGIDDGSRFEAILADSRYQVQPERGQPGRAVHAAVEPFLELRAPAFCGGVCHEVTAQTGARSHEMLSEYKTSPAAARGVTCVDCHMGSEQGKESPFEVGPVAVVGGVPTSERPLSNHFMAGPDYSIIHPGLFPHNVQAEEFRTPREWIEFDVEAGWGTDEFEDVVAEDHPFPEAWESVDDRYEAREIIDEQLELLAWANERRLEVLRNGFGLSEVSDIRKSRDGLSFSLEVSSLTDGHSVPTSFDIKRTVFLQVTVSDSAGRVVYRSGDRDPNGDLRDRDSLYVLAGRLPYDHDLFNLQSKTYVGIVRGPERSQALAPPMSITAMPMVRPDARPTLLYGRTGGSRKHRAGLLPGQSRTATYHVPVDSLRSGETYTIEASLIFQPVPINLIHTTEYVGFDFGLSAKEVADRIVTNAAEIWRREASAGYDVALAGAE